MPRPIEQNRWRRIAEQTIMWVILAVTVGMAGLVDRASNRLGPVLTIGGVTLQLPRGWRTTENGDQSQIELSERGDSFARTISVRHAAPSLSLSNLLAGAPKKVREESVPLLNGTGAQLRVLRRSVERIPDFGTIYELDVVASVPTPSSRNLLISISQLSRGDDSDVDTNVRLMRRILATVRYE